MTWAEYFQLATAVIVSATVLVVFVSWVRRLPKVPAHVKANTKTEQRLLNSILADIKNNPSHWVSLPYDMSSQREPHMINDKKNMAIMVSSGNGDTVTIKMNLKSAHKYKDNVEETIATTIKGAHVRKFIRKAEGLIDTRGKELSFIEDMLDRRL